MLCYGKEKGFWRNLQLGCKETHILDAVSACKITLLSCKEIVLIPCLIQNSSTCKFKDSWIKILTNIQYDQHKHNKICTRRLAFLKVYLQIWTKPCIWKDSLRRVVLVALGALLNKQMSWLIRSAIYGSLRGMRQCFTTSENAITKQIWHRKVSFPEGKLQGAGTLHDPEPVTSGGWVWLLQFRWGEAISNTRPREISIRTGRNNRDHQ